ncbi:MAG: DUF5615 family PIN-like protein [Pseudomonadota bacterium]
MAERQRFLCDEMLARLGRWLRAAGYDTEIAAPGLADRDLIELARTHGRLLITRDRKFLEYKDAAERVLVLHANELEACVRELSQRLSLDWQYRPFSRCMVCNTPLQQARPEELAQVPEQARARVERLYKCQGCQRLYWEGSHVRRMSRQLQRWQQAV